MRLTAQGQMEVITVQSTSSRGPLLGSQHARQEMASRSQRMDELQNEDPGPATVSRGSQAQSPHCEE